MSDLLTTYNPLTTLLEGSSKEKIKEIAHRQAAAIMDAGTPEQAFALLSKVELLVKETKDRLKSEAYDEVVKGNDNAFGVKMSTMASTRYDYSTCNDAELAKHEENIAKHSQLLKERQTFLKGLKKPVSVLNEETGEVDKIFPPAKLVTDTIKVKF